jgi:hypothetical protein
MMAHQSSYNQMVMSRDEFAGAEAVPGCVTEHPLAELP